MQRSAIQLRGDEVREGSDRAFQMNLSIPDSPPHCDPAHEAQLRAFLFGCPLRPTPDPISHCSEHSRSVQPMRR